MYNIHNNVKLYVPLSGVCGPSAENVHYKIDLHNDTYTLENSMITHNQQPFSNVVPEKRNFVTQQCKNT